MNRHRAVGILGVILGSVALIMYARIPSDRLIIPESSFFFVRHFLGITVVNVSLGFMVFGILTFIGVLIPHHAEEATEITRACNNLLGALLLLPFWISLFSTIAIMSQSLQWKIIGFAMFVGLCAMIVSGVRTLRGKQE